MKSILNPRTGQRNARMTTIVILVLMAAAALGTALFAALDRSAEAQTTDTGICQRTEAVRDAIVDAIPDAASCSQVTTAQLAQVTGHLDLSELDIAEIRIEDLNGLSALESIDLSGNSLTYLSLDTFDQLTSVRGIDASDNDINYVGMPFHNNTMLRSVDLSDNDISEIPLRMFANSSHWEYVNLENNLLQAIDFFLPQGPDDLISFRMAGNPGAPFAISVDIMDVGDNAFEVIAGAPSEIIVTLSATGGTLSSSQVVIPPGAPPSEVIAVEHQGDGAAVIRISELSYDTSIYTGLAFTPGPDVSIAKDSSSHGICSRSRGVQNVIIGMVGKNHHCGGIGNDTLSHLRQPFAVVETDLASLRSGDLAGLTAVKHLYLYGNQLTELPAGLFKDAGSFERVLMQDNPGSDFILEVNLVQTATGATKAFIREGTPFWTIVELGAQNGTVHPRIVNIYGGNTQSDESISVTPDTPGQEATITVERVSFQDTGLIKYHYHDGFHVVPGRDLRGLETVESTGDGGVYPSDPPVPEPTPAATATPTPTANPPAADSLTATLQNPHSFHDGESAFTFELRFSEEFGLSYKTLRDHAFTVTGAAVREAQRLEQGSNIGWRITVQPNGNGDVTVVLPETTYCDAQGAICTEDGRKLSHRLALTVNGPGQ